MTRADGLALAALLGALLVVTWPAFGGGFLADPLSELPVRLWAQEAIPRFGGLVASARFPNPGTLNDPDPLGGLVAAVLAPLGRAAAWNTWVMVQLAATLLATWGFLRALHGNSTAAAFGAITFALTPLTLVYGVAGAVVDTLALWPYPLCAWGILAATRAADPRRPAFLAGLTAGLAFVACPYDVLVFLALGVPLAVWGAWRTRRRLLLPGLAFGCGGALLAGPYLLRMVWLLADADSQMSAEAVAASRHHWPFPLLSPAHTHRYTAFLVDYVAVGKDALIERVAAARFYRAFSPGWVLLVPALLGRSRWLLLAAFAVLASTGPFLPLTGDLALPWPVNPAWWALQPLGGFLLLEPFRYATAAAFALAVAGSVAIARFERRLPGLGLVAATAWLLELLVVSPVPAPLPTAPMAVPAAYGRLSTLLPSGAILDLPYFDRGSDRFRRERFLFQLVHGRPIPDEVAGFVPAWLAENQFTAALLHAEKPTGALGVRLPHAERIDADRDAFVAAGFAGVVVTPAAYANERVRGEVRALLAAFGEPVEVEGLDVYRAR